ncbi:hypothetical protein [Pyrodictium abyssi]|uniref:Uncharacterized protein n=1 Tax=Pyrodictium abyssi TaxID=54256 RepID=A0ABN6ZVE2_9CREN|nr:hypothetical protein PABY_21340 [Pyrodictium abyssi]
MRRLEALALAMVLAPALLAVGVLAEAAYDKLHTQLEDYGLEDTAYRDMEATATYTVSNPLTGVSPPPWSPTWSPKSPAMLTCTCSPTADDPNIHGAPRTILTLGEGEAVTETVTWSVGEAASLGTHTLAYMCTCKYLEWQRYMVKTKTNITTTTTVNDTTTTTTTTTTVTRTKTRTRTVTTTLSDAATLMVIPRRVNETLLGLDLNVSLLQVLVDYPVPGQSSALVNMTVRLYNFGLGLGNATLPREDGMLLLHNLAVMVNGVPVIRCDRFCAPAQPLPVAGEPVPSVSGSAELVLTPPREPGNEYMLNITICYTEDRPEPVTTCVEDRLPVFLPFKWRLTVLMDDACRVYNRLWEIVPLGEPSAETVVADAAKPGLREERGCIVAAAGACESVELQVDGDGVPVASRAGRGEAKWCPMEPGVYTARAVDEYGNVVTGTFTITWSAGPPPALKHALLRLALTLVALMAMAYILAGGRWPLRGL